MNDGLRMAEKAGGFAGNCWGKCGGSGGRGWDGVKRWYSSRSFWLGRGERGYNKRKLVGRTVYLISLLLKVLAFSTTLRFRLMSHQ